MIEIRLGALRQPLGFGKNGATQMTDSPEDTRVGRAFFLVALLATLAFFWWFLIG